MRTLFVLVAILFSASASAQGVAQYPFCLQGADYPGWTNCNFTSYQQCQATASGTENECLANPWYNAADGAAPNANTSPPSADGPIPIGLPPRN